MILRIAIAVVFLIHASALIAQDVRKKALFIIADGIPPDVIEKVNTPNLDEIAEAAQVR